MSRLWRLGAVLLFATLAAFAPAGVARADHCPPIPNPDPIPGSNTTYCHTPKPSPTPKGTPKPSGSPKATSAPQTAAPAGPRITTRPAGPAETPFDIDPIEVPTDEPSGTPEIVVQPGGFDDEDFVVGDGAEAGSTSNTIFGFIAGFLVGGLVGRASWGFRRKRRQQIFG